MALNPGACVIAPGGIVTGTGLAKAIGDACMAPNPPGSTTESSLQNFCNRLALAIVEHFITNGQITVTVPPGVPVATTGTAAAQAGATTSPGVGTGTIA